MFGRTQTTRKSNSEAVPLKLLRCSLFDWLLIGRNDLSVTPVSSIPFAKDAGSEYSAKRSYAVGEWVQ